MVEIRARQQESVKKSVLFTPEQGERLLEQYETVTKKTAKYKCCTDVYKRQPIGLSLLRYLNETGSIRLFKTAGEESQQLFHKEQI